ncbi:phosphatidate cytidylyltransferase [Hasllibacter halocynthiae]|uniref:Phosphatidate cytidylyltransferase n=1 Tax=Hasllibacter halocynthiae TaxID=595589 RepID=A0A2T0X811_9RHOB|nr:phosphatidate cytidylyltransferase [Hasllibacter halocynthiae]PRY95090.1 phosphatidate cytidylyltransferase [Hasllibacter halocynthiae]
MSGPREADWSDLSVRFGVATVLAVIGIFAMWLGGWFFYVMIAVICGTVTWELARMLQHSDRMRPMDSIPTDRAPRPPKGSDAVWLGLGSGAALLLAFALPYGLALPLLLAPAMASLEVMRGARAIFVPYCVLILLAGWGLGDLRAEAGFGWMLWLALVVIATDVFGYFAGRQFGGPKFWPRMSPKKTWSGTIAGWVAAAAVGLAWWLGTDAGIEVVGISVALSMASQMGDIAESAVKRKMGVKDSSDLLPGHGGLFDRFDGMLGAAILLLVFRGAAEFPPAIADAAVVVL